jgi:hypothetical protein
MTELPARQGHQEPPDQQDHRGRRAMTVQLALQDRRVPREMTARPVLLVHKAQPVRPAHRVPREHRVLPAQLVRPAQPVHRAPQVHKVRRDRPALQVRPALNS